MNYIEHRGINQSAVKKGEKYSQENEDGYLYLTRYDVNDRNDGSPMHVSPGAWPNEKKIPIGQKSTFSFRFFSFSTG